ncbi:hypothetical protein vB_AbaM_Acibel004_112 [Acinetobacter phage vB_AbaM_Acibel004]|uniref:hypothetical protein n=1 Tax=Acinetobacter phage vB_AbaM_Acibel004 TaxID=1481186 RepID=UPI0004E84918|nr:hypothetical protein vB_AbaM_Acibel004_112 [Acinetobacter phage vB_AbaM_Acibel004]AHY26727.1 hypothetical protein vB_AbaM_Acibel004_112 [Acinetobacter phage vB_AbaM_Acibel004]
MFGKKVTCANKIASKSLDVFAGAKEQIQSGMDEIVANRANRVVLKEELQAQLAEVCGEIDKDDENLALLKGKLESIDKLI